MATPAEHYQKAEEYLNAAQEVRLRSVEATAFLHFAQVHATLATYKEPYPLHFVPSVGVTDEEDDRP